MNARDALNEIKWRYSMDLEGVEIWYIHRGAPDNMKMMSGRDVRNIGSYGIETERATIPYHRIVRIIFNGRVFFDREHERNRRAEKGDS